MCVWGEGVESMSLKGLPNSCAYQRIASAPHGCSLVQFEALLAPVLRVVRPVAQAVQFGAGLGAEPPADQVPLGQVGQDALPPVPGGQSAWCWFDLW